MTLKWLFLDMNAFFASVEQQERPQLRGKPVGVVPVMSDTTCCIAASYEAKAFGVKTGTNVGEAKRLCPHIFLVEAKHGPYQEYHKRIVEVVENCLPVSKILSIDEMVCKLWANDRHPADAAALGVHIKSEIRRLIGECMHCSVGISTNPFLAKVAAELEKPNGLVIMDDDVLPHSLFSMKLTDFPGISRAMAVRFTDAGVFTTEQMCYLSVSEMRSIWGGVNGERWWKLLRGLEVETPENPRRSISHSHVLPPELRTVKGASAVAFRLMEKAAARLRHYEFHASGMGVFVRGENREGWNNKVRFSPCADQWTLLGLMKTLLDHPFTQPMQVGVVLTDLVPSVDVTLSLFDDRDRYYRAALTVDEINRRYGRGKVIMASSLPAAAEAGDKIAFGKVSDFG